MATSPNYSWPEPDNTDLVKNGALAIRTMGNAIDTTMATMTPKSTYTAKGSIAAATGASTPANLSVGNNGETLVADSSTSTGLRYQSNFAAGKNKIINGDMGIWQRGTSFNPSATGFFYTADRWKSYAYASTATTISQQTFSPGTAPIAGYEGTYFLRANSTNTKIYIAQLIEDVRQFAGQTATISFWAKSASNQTLTEVSLYQDFGTGGSTGAIAFTSSSIAVTTSWTRYTLTGSVPSISGKTIGTNSNLTFTITGAINNALDIWGVQVEAGSVATAFQTATGTIQGELAACQRYYYNSMGQNQIVGINTNATTTILTARPPVTMRTTPTATLPSSGSIDSYQDGSKTSASAPTSVYLSDSLAVFASGGYTVLTIGSTATWRLTTPFQLSAEL